MMGVLEAILQAFDFFGIKALDLHAYLINPITVLIITGLTIATFVSKYLGFEGFEPVKYASRGLFAEGMRLLGRKIVLLYVDTDDEHYITSTLIPALKKANEATEALHFHILRSGDELIAWPIRPSCIRSLVLIITDVTTLSNLKTRRDKIQRKITHYVKMGGCAVFTHDVLYRRTKNHILQGLTGGQITSFHQVTAPIGYERCVRGEHAPAVSLDQLPQAFTLNDREVMSGHWAPNVEFLYVWRENPAIPLMTRRQIGKGTVYWLNSGDTNAEGPPASVAKPEAPFAQILAAATANAFPKASAEQP